MHVNVQLRNNPQTGDRAPYYRLKESYRDVRGNVHSLIVLNIGFEPNLSPANMRRIAVALTERFKNRNEQQLFPLKEMENLDDTERVKAEEFWTRMQEEGNIDRFDRRESEARNEASRYVDLDSVEHTDARNVGAEWLCKQAIDKLGFEEFLHSEGWSENSIHTALSHLIIRTVYAPSELSTIRYMEENSAACELYSGNPSWRPGLNALYKIPNRLYELKEKLEKHLCNRTDSLFNLTNRIVLFDLTNFYFEGRKAKSTKAKFGRSKEKRYDCRLLVMALCINEAGFIRYSSILEGNTADPMSLPDMIDKLALKSPAEKDKTLVVMDAGIATEENFKLVKEKGYNYLCVSRNRLKDYQLATDHKSIIVKDARKQEITLREVCTPTEGDYYLEITSPSKALTESSMNRQWRTRFEEELKKANDGINKRSGTKNYEKVIERVGRALQKYPSIAKFYNIQYIRDEKDATKMKRVEWELKDPSSLEKSLGIYFLRTNVRTLDEKTTWDYYNLIREIECTNRQLKNDLNLRPIYHQKDESSDAHLFFGLLAYWVVNTIRYELKQSDIKCYWTEITRRMSTQKLVTTNATNALGEDVVFRQCSRPSKSAKEIYDALRFKHAPFKKIQICRTQS